MCRIDLRCHLSKRLGVDLFARPCRSYPTRRWRGRYAGRDRRALTELLVDKIIIAPHPHKIDKAGRRHYTIRAIPYQDPRQEAERLRGECPTNGVSGPTR
jgi:hypothetical protein